MSSKSSNETLVVDAEAVTLILRDDEKSLVGNGGGAAATTDNEQSGLAILLAAQKVVDEAGPFVTSCEPAQDRAGEVAESFPGVWCWLCDDPASCEMCRPDEPGQLGLFEVSEDGA